MPFSRQFFLAAIAFTPLVPWDVKMKGVEVRRGGNTGRKYRVCQKMRLLTFGHGATRLQWYLRRNFFGPSGLGHWLPSGAAHEIDYSGTYLS